MQGYKAGSVYSTKQSSVFSLGLYQFQLINTWGMTEQPSVAGGRSISRQSQRNPQLNRYADALGSHLNFSSLTFPPLCAQTRMTAATSYSFIIPLPRINWEFLSFSTTMKLVTSVISLASPTEL